MSKNNSTANATDHNVETCTGDICNGFGECRVLNPGMLIERFECMCDLWHTGQLCQYDVPLPIAITITTTLFTWLILFFFWYSSRRFEKKKIHFPSRRRRFVDYLINAQRSEKLELNSQQQLGNRHSGSSELVKSESRKKAKSSNQKEKVKPEKRGRATATTGAGPTIDQSLKGPTGTTMASERGMTMTQTIQKEKSIKKKKSEKDERKRAKEVGNEEAAADNQTVTQGMIRQLHKDHLPCFLPIYPRNTDWDCKKLRSVQWKCLKRRKLKITSEISFVISIVSINHFCVEYPISFK